MRLAAEKYWPFVLAGILALGVYFLPNKLIASVSFKEFGNSVMVVFCILIGFLLTVVTLLHTINTEIMVVIRGRTNDYKRLVLYLKLALFSALTICFITIFFPFSSWVDIEGILSFKISMLALKKIYLVLTILATTLMYRFIRVLIMVLV